MIKRLLVVSLLATAFVFGGTAFAQTQNEADFPNIAKGRRDIDAIRKRAGELESSNAANSARSNLTGLWNAVEADEKGDNQALVGYISGSTMPAVPSMPTPIASSVAPGARVLPRSERASVPARPSLPTPPSKPRRMEPRETRQVVAPKLPTSIPAKVVEKPATLPNLAASEPQPPAKQVVASKPIPNREVKEAHLLFDKRGPEEVGQLAHRYQREGLGVNSMIVQDLQDRTREYEVPKARFYVERYLVPTDKLVEESNSMRLPSSPGYVEK